MKKLLIGLFVILSVSALADGYNLYIKGGTDFYGNKACYAENTRDIIDPANFKTKEAELNRAYETFGKNNDTDVDNAVKYMQEFYAKGKDKITLTENNKFIKSYNLSLEGTKSISDKIEVGLGVAYKINKNNKLTYAVPNLAMTNIKANDIAEEQNPNTDAQKAKNSIAKMQKHVNSVLEFAGLKSVFTDAYFNSIPVYATVKFNVGDFSDFKPYVKADLGYAFNIGFKKPTVEHYENGALIAGQVANDEYKLSNGIYLGGAVGTEYKNFVVEVAASYIPATVKVTDKANVDKTAKYDASKFNIGVNAGYKFSF